ncbi:hypothetical protein CC86DRAFT_197631 [Ophiobolus disseminans]|uniref:Uncharacterized protein n=1 Tax=Ophiobolus disseminans TaxID=1469910 RepID=A0A6A7A635_9PLEO|nr:hypothetical protein CC86DRAFT_197631 [Ophiobolus disseminans]
MPGLLSRSKSMRLLRGHRKEVQQEQAQSSMPRSGLSKTYIDRDRSATPILRAEAKSDTPDLALRPSTSGGTGERRTLFHMKTTPAPSIHSPSDLTFPLPSDSTTTFRTAEVTDSREGIIGIALGSPTAGSHWTSTPQAAYQSTSSQAVNGQMSGYTQNPRFPSPVPGRQEPPKSKLGRWKSLFRKAAPPTPQPDRPAFYQLTTTITATRATRADSHHDDEPTESQVEPPTDRHTGRTPSPPTFKPNIRASRTFTTPPEVPRTRTRAFTAGTLPANPRASVQRSATTPLPSGYTASDSPAMPQLKSSKSTQNVTRLPGETPLLDVSIPDITLDRYSVMFNNLLQSSNRTSSLLVRRQGNAEKLKPLNQLSAKSNEQESPMDYSLKRRATSPVVPSPSPRLSLFPNTNPTRAASPPVPRTKALHRSKTAPEKSPLRQTYSRAEMNKANEAQDLFIQKPTGTPNLKPRASMNLKVQQLAITPTSVHSFESDADSITIVVGRTGQPQTLHLDDREPDWEICAKPKPAAVVRANTTPVGLARTDSQRQPKVTKFSALSSHAPSFAPAPSSAPLEAPSPLQRIQLLQSPPQSAREKRTASESRPEGAPKAMVGVARSISVSRANSPRAIVRTTNELRSPGERLGEGKCLTPTMVEVRNRKSQRVQLVDA